MKPNRVRQKEIAERTGFSINTVSLALQGSPRISEDTRQKIMECAEKLNYIPNVIARSLVQKRTHTIGIILTSLLNPILTVTAQEIEQSLKAAGYNMMLMITNNKAEQEAEALDMLVSRQVDGIILYPVVSANFTKIKTLRDNNFPLILLAGGSYEMPTDAVFINRKAGTYTSTAHFIKAGHKRIGLMSSGSSGDSEKRNGYLAALQDHGIEADPSLIMTVRGSFEAGYSSIQALYEQGRPTAVVCSRDEIALGAMRWCMEQGIRIPEELSFIGFDDIPAAGYAGIPLSSIRYDVKMVTKKAVDLLLRRIEEKDISQQSELQHIAIDPKLIIRQS